MDWERISTTVEVAYRRNGKEASTPRGRTPLSDLIAKDPVPDLDEMTEPQLLEFAAVHHIAIDREFERFDLIETIKDALDKNWDERLKAIRGMLDHIFADGPHPLAVVRRLYGLTKAVRPQCLMDMPLVDLAVLCNDGNGHSSDGRATQSARIKRLFEEPIKKAGMRGCKAPFQKTTSACDKYAEKARGNQNRHGSGFLKINGSNHPKKKAA
jgi:hypothetical protein